MAVEYNMYTMNNYPGYTALYCRWYYYYYRRNCSFLILGELYDIRCQTAGRNMSLVRLADSGPKYGFGGEMTWVIH